MLEFNLTRSKGKQTPNHSTIYFKVSIVFQLRKQSRKPCALFKIVLYHFVFYMERLDLTEVIAQ